MTQAKSAGLHSAEQVRVRVHWNQINLLGKPAHERIGEVFAGSDKEQVTEDAEGKRRRQKERVQVALMVGAEQVRTCQGQVLAP